jgi:hypothetical protein
MVTDLPTTTFSGVNVMAVFLGFTVKKQNLNHKWKQAMQQSALTTLAINSQL